MKKIILLVLVLSLCTVTEQAKADYTFGKPQNLGDVINTASSDYGACISADGLELYFASERADGFGAADIWVSTRQSVDDPWGPPANLGAAVNGPYSESYPSLSSDGLTLYFSDAYTGTARPGGLGGGDIWITTRPSRDVSWGAPVNVGAPINGSNLDMSPTISGDGLTLVFNSRDRAGGFGSWDLWMSTRAGVQDPWGPPVNLGSTVNSGDWEGECGLSRDGLALFYGSGRTGIVGAVDIWMSTRKTLADPWAVAVNLGPVVNSSSNDGTARLSPDMRMLYFCSDRPGGYGSYDLLQSPIAPVVDLNGDRIVDAADICILVDNWNTDNPLCDIGPAPWGDGIVDVEDLKVLAEHLFEDYRLIAHWKLDEDAGDIARDSVGEHDATLHGGPSWRPLDGRTAGALELDGSDDYVSTPFVMNPANGAFSAFAWVKGGVPGQVIISQADVPGNRGTIPGSTWLGVSTSEGKLMTGFGGVQSGTLESQSVITDDQWHHVGLIYDLDVVHRRLYLDGALIAEDDTAVAVVPSDGGIYIGAGKDLEAGGFFSGLIDDVRIYNVPLSDEQIASLAQ